MASGAGLLVVLSGPSGVGKDTVLRRLMQLDSGIHLSVSFTTRSPRTGEQDGVAYSFVDEPRFRAMAERGDFLEWAEVHGALYGTSLERVATALDRGDDVVLKIDVQGAARVRERLAEAGPARRFAGRSVQVFLLPPSADELRRRLVARSGEAAPDLEPRLERSAAELAEAGKYDRVIVNEDVERASRELLEVLRELRSCPPTG